MNRDGTGRRLVPTKPGFSIESSVGWSPDSRRIVYAANVKKCTLFECVPAIHSVGVDGRAPRTHFVSRKFLPKLRPTHPTRRAGLYQPRFSPDGSRIAFIQDEGEGAGLYVARPDGSGRRRLGEILAEEPFSYSWSPSGRELVFIGVSREDLPENATRWMDLYVINADATGRRLLFSNRHDRRKERWQLHGVAWSPDGGTIMFRRSAWGEPAQPDELAFISARGGEITSVRFGPPGCRITLPAAGVDEPCGVFEASWSRRP